MGTYTFALKVTASGNAVFYSSLTLNVVYDCDYDNITIVTAIPHLNSRVEDMIYVGLYPVV